LTSTPKLHQERTVSDKNQPSATNQYGVLGALEIPLALGLLRLSTEGRPQEADAIALIQRALDQGIRVLDTADSYALGEHELHYGERLARKAIAQWRGPSERVRVLTKVGMARPKGRWVPNARPEHIRRAVDGSLAALGVERLFMLLLHGNDPGCAFEDSLATLAELQRTGKIEHLGLCNAEIAEVRQAQRLFNVAAIQNELSVINRKSATEGMLELARELGIPLLAHRPLGGHSKVATLEKNRAMKPIADRYQIGKHEAALACLLDLGAPVLPLFGATRMASVDASVLALRTKLDAKDRALLSDKISFEATPEARAQLAPLPVPHSLREAVSDHSKAQAVVIVMGVQGAGKSTQVQKYLYAGYARLNRDQAGGNLDALLPLLTEHLRQGQRVVLDNTYATRVSRWGVVRTAHAAGVPVRCVHLATPVKDALINIVQRTLDRYGRLLGPDDLKELSKSDPNLPPPAALARYAACFEAPQQDEGFATIESHEFVRSASPLAAQKALFLDVDGTLRLTRSGEIYPRDADDVQILPNRREKLAQWLDQGWRLFFVSNQSGIASGNVTESAVREAFERTRELLGLPITDIAFCPHPAFPVACYCRKPMPGMAVALARKHGLALSESVMVGDRDSDAQFAAAIGARYFDAEAFFASN